MGGETETPSEKSPEANPDSITRLVQRLSPKMCTGDKPWFLEPAREAFLSRHESQPNDVEFLSPQTEDFAPSERGREDSQISCTTQSSETTDVYVEAVVSLPTWKNGSVAYVEPSSGSVSSEITFVPNASRPVPFNFHLSQSIKDRRDTEEEEDETVLLRRGDFIYRNADFYGSLRKISAATVEFHASSKEPIPAFDTWSAATEDVIQKTNFKLSALKASVMGIGICAGIPPGTLPALGHGRISVLWWLAQAFLRQVELGMEHRDDFVDCILEFIECAKQQNIQIGSLSKFNVLSLSPDWFDTIIDAQGNPAEGPIDSTQPFQLESFKVRAPLSAMIVADLDTKAKLLRHFSEMPSQMGQAPSTAVYGQMLMAKAVFKSALCILESLSVHTSEERELLSQKIKMYRGLIDFERQWEKHDDQQYQSWANISHSAQYLVVLLVNLTALLDKLHWASESEEQVPLVTTDSGLVYDRSGKVRGGSRAALVAEITHHDQLSDATTAFLLTYPAFLSDVDFIDLLQDRFSIQPLNGLSRDSFGVWEETIQKPIRFRVSKVLKQWLESYWPANPHEEVALRVTRFVDRLNESGFPGASKLKDVLLKRTEGEQVEKPRKSSLTPFEESLVLRPHSVLSLEDVPPLEMARQLTLHKYGYFSKITHRELLWRHSVPEEDNVGEFINIWNQETCWVCQQLLQPTEPLERARRIEYFIRVSKGCRILNNFSSMMSIITALYSAGVYRLGATWPLVRGEHVSDLQAMCRLMNSARNFGEYRMLLSLVSTPAIPFLGVCLMDIRFTLDGNSDYLGGDPALVNWAKWSQCASIIFETFRFQEMCYPLKPLPEVQAFLSFNISKAPSLSELYELSRTQEPKA